MPAPAASKERALGEDPPPRRSTVSDALLAWVVPLLVKGYSRPLTEEDPPRLQSHLRCGRLSARAAELWREEASRGRPSLCRVVAGLTAWVVDLAACRVAGLVACRVADLAACRGARPQVAIGALQTGQSRDSARQ